MSSATTTVPRAAPPVATFALILAQMVAWVVVNRYLVAGGQWSSLALRPGAPTDLGLLVSPFIHLRPEHLGINLLVLWLVGSNVERSVGSLRFLFLYLGAAWFGALMQWATATSFQLFPDPNQRDAAVGSSGAVAGVLGVCLVRFPGARMQLPLFPTVRFPPGPVITLWAVYTLLRAVLTTLQGISDGIGHWAHLGGFIFGLGAAQLMGLQERGRLDYLAQEAERALRRGDLPAAARAWSALLSQRPHDCRTRELLLEARLEMGDRGGARRLIRDGLEHAVRSGDRTAALACYRMATQHLPDVLLPSGVRFRIGCWLDEAGQPGSACEALWRCLEEDQGEPAAAALHRIGEVAAGKLADVEQAARAWTRLVENYPESAFARPAREGLRRLSYGADASSSR